VPCRLSRFAWNSRLRNLSRPASTRRGPPQAGCCRPLGRAAVRCERPREKWGRDRLRRSVVEHFEIELGQALGVDQEVALDDLPVLDCERSDRERLAVRSDTSPAAPLTSARRIVSPARDHMVAWLATASAPCAWCESPVIPPSALSTTSGSRTATSASKSPLRAAARNASTTFHCSVREESGTGALPRTRRHRTPSRALVQRRPAKRPKHS
jgi:hypothetical protein